MKKIIGLLLSLLIGLLPLLAAQASAADTATATPEAGLAFLWDIPYGVDKATFTALALKNANVTVQPFTDDTSDNVQEMLMFAPDTTATYLGEPLEEGYFFFYPAVSTEDGADPAAPVGYDQAILYFALEQDEDVTSAVAMTDTLLRKIQVTYGEPELTLLMLDSDEENQGVNFTLPLIDGALDTEMLTSALTSHTTVQYTLGFDNVALYICSADSVYSVCLTLAAGTVYGMDNFRNLPMYTEAEAAQTQAPVADAATTFPEDDYLWRGVSLGMTRDQVIAAEGSDPLTQKENYICYESGTVAGLNTVLFYYFNSEGKLYVADVVMPDEHKNNADYITDFDSVDDTLQENFGTPVHLRQPNWAEGATEVAPEVYGDAIQSETLTLSSLWNWGTENIIYHILYCENGMMLHDLKFGKPSEQ